MRQKVLLAATKIIISEGYENLSMRKIAKEIEYTPTTLYTYYKDKMEIVNEISYEVYKKIVDSVRANLYAIKDLPVDKQLEKLLKVFIFTATENAEMAKALMKSGSKAIFGPSERNESEEESGLLFLQKLLLKGQQEQTIRKLDENAAWMIITALIGFSLNAIENKIYNQENWFYLVDIYVEILINGLKKFAKQTFNNQS